MNTLDTTEILINPPWWRMNIYWIDVKNIPMGIPIMNIEAVIKVVLEQGSIVPFDWDRVVLNDGWRQKYVVVGYSDGSTRSEDMKSFITRIDEVILKTEWVDGLYQYPQVVGAFEYAEKYYLILSAVNEVKDMTDSERWIFKNMIINPEAYQASKGAQVENTQDATRIWVETVHRKAA
jgi:hypothetical protein